ncbi:UDP-3-O-(3-hydroxymyristoyl)glucosamine N-acyltransferase [Ferruginibacter lapsinanis]|uniref:UDP-3-O-(3-hydroxymyristoyl)glucosamine N-acyltransferase n=1 Tax=Ferruginibacter lapsinanis TaxID=563172 RepID=UPI001E5EC6D3|nr:UDP-3-O-(3-hydroxymyristoyl)glucosamine N-acyltransferase [Ferruginibacter lapsinanis]UEG49603.1 UDP-3-O-(3-hydroxymyristoyl)glucosamine N-acyltransferase [Ferruginibacter lapsinanis]
MLTFSIHEINEKLKGVIVGNTTQSITGPEQLELANDRQISFIGNKKYIKLWESSKACAAIINEDIDLEPGANKAFIKVKDADIAMAELLELFVTEPPVFEEMIHATAVIHPTAIVGNGCKIGAGCYVGKNVQLGNDVVLYPNTTILDNTTIGNNTTIWSGTVIRERCVIGSHCIIHPNVTIGADGFGFRPSPDGRGLIKIPHIGNVIIGNGVEIGASSCIDRGKFSATIVGDGCKIDNLVQIGHNSKMGRSCIMAGSSGLAGSVTLGDGVIVGGGACISDHVILGNGVQVGGASGVINNFGDGKKILGYPAIDARDALKQWVVLRKLVKESK